MLKNRLLFWKIISGLYTLSIFYFCLKRPSSGGVSVPHLDKVFHFSCYFLYLLLLRLSFFRKRAVWSLPYAFFFGFLIEALQAQTSYRSFEWADMLANGLGALCAYVLFSHFKKRVSFFHSNVDI